jgi:parvulin-like peptidyl-prolyl isomerase
VGLLALAFCWGRFGSLPRATAVPPASPAPAGSPAAPADAPSDYARRWVAVIHGNMPITREEFGEYLITRHSDQLELLVNKRIIELACKQRGLEVTAAEIEAALAEDLKGLQVSLKDFVNQILMPRYHKTLYEWKEDVIRPKLALAKLCRDRVKVTDQDFQDAFDAYYGEKVECRLILFPKDQEKLAMEKYGELRSSDAAFDQMARKQWSATLAGKGGEIRPIAHKTTGNPDLEKEAFSLQPGEVSRLIETPQGLALLKCVKRIPPDNTKSLEKERPALEKEIVEKKIQLEIPNVVKELKEQAQPKFFLQKPTTQEELERDVKRAIQGGAPQSKPPVR